MRQKSSNESRCEFRRARGCCPMPHLSNIQHSHIGTTHQVLQNLQTEFFQIGHQIRQSCGRHCGPSWRRRLVWSMARFSRIIPHYCNQASTILKITTEQYGTCPFPSSNFLSAPASTCRRSSMCSRAVGTSGTWSVMEDVLTARNPPRITEVK